MKKVICSIIILINIISPNILGFNTIAKAENGATITQTEQYPSYCKEALLSLLYPYISNAVNEYYNNSKQFDIYDAEILSIKKIGEKFQFRVVVQIETYTGPHNPPGGRDTITISTGPMGTKVVNYIHKEK
ncbi:DUF3888 domain-containing protein [Desnuesiella massiliensis]|uniref:DUF3888 domain-containing protein n=1 Tax=Desnuesiella massiliensis TaxID=1650662 RepID=UPI0006E3D04C|nr:DUF3888 domain-containing protein [Desnuesiella massiliensis]